MRFLAVLVVSAALGVSSAFLVACGDRNSLIPEDDAAAMRSDLERASSLYDQEECRASQAAVLSARARAAELPAGVDADLRTTLRENLDHALARVRAECGRTETTQTTQTTETATQPTETTETTTEPPPTTTETEPPPTTTETEPPGGGGGGGSGSGGSGGGSGGTPAE